MSGPKRVADEYRGRAEHVALERPARFVYHARMSGLFDGTPLQRPVTCKLCEKPLDQCSCPRSAKGAVLLPRDQRARVGREKRRGGKTVTVITGLDPAASNLADILGQLKTACAAGGTIRADGIEIQGNHRQRALALLRDLGYPAKITGR